MRTIYHASAARARLIPGLVLGALFAIGCALPRYSVVVGNESAEPMTLYCTTKDPVTAYVAPGSRVGVESSKRFWATVGRWDPNRPDGFVLAQVEATLGYGGREPPVVVFDDEQGVTRLRVRTGAASWRVLERPSAHGTVERVTPFSFTGNVPGRENAAPEDGAASLGAAERKAKN